LKMLMIKLLVLFLLVAPDPACATSLVVVR